MFIQLLFNDSPISNEIVKKYHLKKDEVINQELQRRGGRKMDDATSEEQLDALEKYGHDLVQDVKDSTSDLNTQISDAIEGLKALGYKANEINAIISELKNHEGLTSDEYLKLGLQLIMKRKIGG